MATELFMPRAHLFAVLEGGFPPTLPFAEVIATREAVADESQFAAPSQCPPCTAEAREDRLLEWICSKSRALFILTTVLAGEHFAAHGTSAASGGALPIRKQEDQLNVTQTHHSCRPQDSRRAQDPQRRRPPKPAKCPRARLSLHVDTRCVGALLGKGRSLPQRRESPALLPSNASRD
jgi:hypothetical protein